MKLDGVDTHAGPRKMVACRLPLDTIIALEDAAHEHGTTRTPLMEWLLIKWAAIYEEGRNGE